jgi:short-subunit dehydrogenase
VPIAAVTGASAGVGRATAVALAKKGYDVALLARGKAGLDGAAEDVRRQGRRALPLAVDVSDAEAVDRAAERIESELGPIELWVNDAMTTVFAPSWDIDANDFRRAVEVTFLGQVWGTQAALARMRPRDRGTIVEVGSALSYMAIPLQSAYCASKFACRGYFEAVRAELLHEKSGIRMCMVHLPAVNTPQFDWCQTTLDRHPMPVPPIYQPELIAEKIISVALSGQRERVVGSWNKLLVWAGKAFPGLANQFAGRSAWEGQLADRPLQPGRQPNLRHPVDAARDRGSRGSFDSQSGGFWDPSFLKSLPSTAGTFVIAAAATTAEKAQRLRVTGRAAPGRGG